MVVGGVRSGNYTGRSMTNTRKTPTSGRARKLFIRHPFRSNQDWAVYWGVSRERVRQMRAEAHVPTRQAIAEAARTYIRSYVEAEL